MELCSNYEPDNEFGTDLPLEGISIERYEGVAENWDEPSITIWRVEHDKTLPSDWEELTKLVRLLDWSCDPESERCNHDHDCCGCSFVGSFGVDYVDKKLAYIRKETRRNY
jgi:hypothetical protein|tara:strand:+ start:345 stop:677 length:333 start_codon:yes stop_codon:yes gene_type:complete